MDTHPPTYIYIYIRKEDKSIEIGPGNERDTEISISFDEFPATLV